MVRLEDVLVDAVAAQCGGRVSDLLADLISPLRVARGAGPDDGAGSDDLIRTATVYLEADGSVARTAAALPLHRNSVAYRLERIHTLTGVDPRTTAGAFLLTAALAGEPPAG